MADKKAGPGHYWVWVLLALGALTKLCNQKSSSIYTHEPKK